MTGSFRPLVTRAMSRTGSDRSAVIGALLALLILAITSISVTAFGFQFGSSPAERGEAIRVYGWQVTELYTILLYTIAFTLGANQIASDIKAGTIFGVLARPASRARIFLAGWAVSALLLTLLEGVRSGLLVVLSSWFQGRLDPKHLLGVAAVLSGEMLVLAAMAALGSALPPAYALLGALIGFVATLFAFTPTIVGPGRYLLDAVAAVLPLASRQDEIVSAALVGSARNSLPILEVLAYRLVWTGVLLAVGCLLFSRRDVAPRV